MQLQNPFQLKIKLPTRARSFLFFFIAQPPRLREKPFVSCQTTPVYLGPRHSYTAVQINLSLSQCRVSGISLSHAMLRTIGNDSFPFAKACFYADHILRSHSAKHVISLTVTSTKVSNLPSRTTWQEFRDSSGIRKVSFYLATHFLARFAANAWDVLHKPYFPSRVTREKKNATDLYATLATRIDFLDGKVDCSDESDGNFSLRVFPPLV